MCIVQDKCITNIIQRGKSIPLDKLKKNSEIIVYECPSVEGGRRSNVLIEVRSHQVKKSFFSTSYTPIGYPRLFFFKRTTSIRDMKKEIF